MKPRILLIGAGAFGSKHLSTLATLEKKGVLKIAGIVVRTQKSADELKKTCTLPIHVGFSVDLLKNVDAVDIVTPVETHAELIQACLPHVHVLVEKPLTANPKEAAALKKLAAKSKHILMVGHIFRFHPVLNKVKQILAKPEFKKLRPLSVEASFVNPMSNDTGRDVELEMLHPYDMVDYLFGAEAQSKHTDDRNRFKAVTLKYPRGLVGLFKLGWKGNDRKRILKITFKGYQIICDIDKNVIDLYQNGTSIEHLDMSGQKSSLQNELTEFIQAIKGKRSNGHPDVSVGERIVRIATMGRAKNLDSIAENKKPRKKVAVIGAGIFGLNAAIELAQDCDVTVFEKNGDILSEASKINQYRHHWGYHYPRSQETVDDIRLAMNDFEERYGEAIITKFPTYYSMAKKGSKVTSKEFTEFCKRNKLPYTIEYPGEEFLDRSKVETCLKTYEPIYDYGKLKKLTAKLVKQSGIKVNLGQEIVGARIIPGNGQKLLNVRSVKNGKKIVREEAFDYVVNATYARNNDFCQWIGLRKKPIRIDLVEVLWVKINSPKISLAVMDGKFSNIVPTGRDSIFTLVHIEESVLRRFVPKNGLVPKNIWDSAEKTRVQKIIDRSAEWFPFVKKAKVLEVHHVLRGVSAYREHDDARISDITEHGFGCYSVFGGKIINSVWIGKQLRKLLFS